MKTNIFIPKQINIGFRERSDTYTKKLAYIIYFDEKGKLRKETSWNGWRDDKIPNEIHDNIPTSGFVLNKKAGGYSTGWNHRQTYVRVYDPRGFEFEISVPNLLYILENATSTKGKGLEGEFIYGWDGKDLVLVPVESPDYVEISKLNEIIYENNFIKAKDLKIGATYLTKDNQKYIYMGKFDEYYYDGTKKKAKSFYFHTDYGYNKGFVTMSSLSKKLISVVSEECVDNYAELIDELEGKIMFCPIDDSKDEYIPYSLDDINEKLTVRNWLYCYHHETKEKIEIGKVYNEKDKYYYNPRSHHWTKQYKGTLEEILKATKPMWKKEYLKNGRLYREEK